MIILIVVFLLLDIPNFLDGKSQIHSELLKYGTCGTKREMPSRLYSFTRFSKRDLWIQFWRPSFEIAELIQGVGAAGHVLGSMKVEEADEGAEVVLAKALVDVLVQPGKK